MRNKLTLITALAVFGCSAVLGVSFAAASKTLPPASGAQLSTVTSGTTGSTDPQTPTPPTPPVGTGGGSLGGGVANSNSGGIGTAPTEAEPAPTVPDRTKKEGGNTGGITSPGAEASPLDGKSDPSFLPFGPSPIDVPNIVIDTFEIPPFLLPIYQACGTQYGIPWQLLAAINKIETGFGTNVNVSTAGAQGWMQFMPETWSMYGVDANGDGRKDPYNPVDAICAAARYLNAAGGASDLRTAVFAYNHADWYVNQVMGYASDYAKLPADLISSLTGLTEGDRFPVAAEATYEDQVDTGTNDKGVTEATVSSTARRMIRIYSKQDAPVVAVNDGTIEKLGHSDKFGDYVVLRDAYGNRFAYWRLGRLAELHPVPKERKLTDEDFKLVSPPDDATPDAPASVTASASPDGKSKVQATGTTGAKSTSHEDKVRADAEAIAKASASEPEHSYSAGDGHAHGGERPAAVNTEEMRPRLYAHPERENNVDRASLNGQLGNGSNGSAATTSGVETVSADSGSIVNYDKDTTELKPLEVGSQVVAGTVLGNLGPAAEGTPGPSIGFAMKPAGKNSPIIDPKPILDGWRLLEATDVYRADAKNPFFKGAGIGQLLLMSKASLMQRVLNDSRLEIYACGRGDIEAGRIDRRVLALLEYLAAKGFNMTITSLMCGHGFLTASGNPSNHSFGRAIDIAVINGVPVYGNQGPGTLTDSLLKSVLQLQGAMYPDELISLENLGGASFALPDHDDHVHVGYSAESGQPNPSTPGATNETVETLSPDQWRRLVDRLGKISNPTVSSSSGSAGK